MYAKPGIGLLRCQRFSGVALFLSFGGGKPLKCRWPGEVTGAAGVSAGMGAFGRDSHSAEPDSGWQVISAKKISFRSTVSNFYCYLALNPVTYRGPRRLDRLRRPRPKRRSGQPIPSSTSESRVAAGSFDPWLPAWTSSPTTSIGFASSTHRNEPRGSTRSSCGSASWSVVSFGVPVSCQCNISATASGRSSATSTRRWRNHSSGDLSWATACHLKRISAEMH